MIRTAAREIAIQLGFAVVTTGQEPETVVGNFFAQEHYDSMAEEGVLYSEKPSAKDLDFITRSVTGVAQHRDELDAYISKYAKGWRTARISRSAVAVMRQAMLEILYMPEIPHAAAINEAVDLAKGYEDKDVVAFINGVLGGFYRGEVKSPSGEENAAESLPEAIEGVAENE